MIREGDLGVRDNCRRKESMGGMAEPALYPAYDQGDLPQSSLYGADIAPMSHKAATMAAGAFELACLDGIHGIIIKFL